MKSGVYAQMLYGDMMVVSFMKGSGSETVPKRRRASCASRQTDALIIPPQQRRRKQRLMSKLCDSGFEEDLVSSPILRRSRTEVLSHLESDELPAAGQLSNWYLQYGDVGFKIQKDKESQFHPCKSLARQPQLTAEARCKLVSWLIPVHKHFRLSFECCCLAVNIMDRFLASTPIAADCFQLLGVTALLLACKQVEVCSPSVSRLLSLCCDAFTKEQFFKLECLILLRLNFRLSAPTLAFFLDYFANCIDLVVKNNNEWYFKVNPGTAKIRQCRNLAQKVCELTLADYAFNKYPPSLTAYCALRLACELLKTKHTCVEHAAIQLQQTHLDKLCTNSVSVQEEPECPEGGSLAGKDPFLSPDEGCYNLVQECKDNLKLLVSLNQETLEAMSNM